MRWLAWLAVFALQTSMFVCSAGIDVCLAGEASPAPAQTAQHAPQPDQPDNGGSAADSGGICLAHAAAHVFIAPPGGAAVRALAKGKVSPAFIMLAQPDIPLLIEQPPKTVAG